MLKISIYLFVLFFISTNAEALDLVQAPQASIHIAPKKYRSKLSEKVGDKAVSAPTWHIAQWNIPVELPSKETFLSNKEWSVSNPFGRVKYIPSIQGYELAQNGDNNSLACAREYDLFLEPNSTDTYPGYASSFKKSSPLSKVSKLIGKVGVDIVDEKIKHRCKIDYVAYTFAVVLQNPTAGQTIFYQIQLRDSRGPTSNLTWCPDYEFPGYNKQFCVTDDISYYGYEPLPINGEMQQLTFDMRPRLAQIIKTAHRKKHSPTDPAIDTDLSHWIVGSMYLGQILEGSAIATSRWNSISLEQF